MFSFCFSPSNNLAMLCCDYCRVDSGTWNLAFDIARTVPNLLVVFTTRPLRSPTPPTYTKITRLKHCTHLTLDLLPKDAMLKLACHKLGVRSIPPDLFELIQKKSGGLPLYIEEVIQTMLERKMVKVENGEVVQLERGGDVLPESMHDVMTGRIDHLPPAQQLVLKLAAAIRMSFFLFVSLFLAVFSLNLLNHIKCAVAGGELKLEVLNAIYPGGSLEVAELGRICTALCEAGFLVPNHDQKGSFQFKHSYLIDTAYKMLSLKQRKEAHAMVCVVVPCCVVLLCVFV
jgi:predicted ATPase